MDRKQFFAELEDALVRTMPREEAEQVLADYEEFFDAGLAEGKSEAEVARELGDPAKIVVSLLEKEPAGASGAARRLEEADASGAARRLEEAGASGAVPKSEEAGASETAPRSETAEAPDSSRGPEAETALPYAPLGERLLAFIIDAVLALFPLTFFGIVEALVLMPFIPGIILVAPVRTNPTTTSIILALIFTAYAYLYQPVFLVLWDGRTPGKRLMRLRVVKEDGTALGPRTAAVRELLGKTIIYTLTFGIGSLVSFFWALFSREHKTIPDVLARTRVIADER